MKLASRQHKNLSWQRSVDVNAFYNLFVGKRRDILCVIVLQVWDLGQYDLQIDRWPCSYPCALKRKKQNTWLLRPCLAPRSGSFAGSQEMTSAFWTIIFKIFLFPSPEAHGGGSLQTLGAAWESRVNPGLVLKAG